MRKLIFIATVISLTRCASPVTPTGGPKDILPPVLLKAEPNNKTTNIKPESITFQFNENIQLKSAQDKIIVSPKVPFTIKQTNKSFQLTLGKDTLKENTTYSISFADCITDLNESNILYQEPYLFSTGNNLDTLNLKGKLIFLKEPKTKKIKVQIKQDKSNTINIASINNNFFTAHGLKNEPYKVYIFNDLNGNDTADINEDKGYNTIKSIDSVISLIYPFSKNAIGFYKINKNTYGINQLEISDLVNTQINKGTILNKDTLLTDSLKFNTIKEYLTETKRYIIPNNIIDIKRKLSYKITQPTISEDSINVLNIGCNVLNDQQIILVAMNLLDTTAYKINLKVNNKITLSNKTPKQKIIISAENYIDTLNITVNPLLPVHFENDDSTEITILCSDKNNNHILKNIPAKSKTTIYTSDPTINITAWHDLNNDRRINGPDFSNSTPGEAFKLYNGINIKPGIEISVKIAVYN